MMGPDGVGAGGRGIAAPMLKVTVAWAVSLSVPKWNTRLPLVPLGNPFSKSNTKTAELLSIVE